MPTMPHNSLPTKNPPVLPIFVSFVTVKVFDETDTYELEDAFTADLNKLNTYLNEELRNHDVRTIINYLVKHPIFPEISRHDPWYAVAKGVFPGIYESQ